jgi:hypothetical protein
MEGNPPGGGHGPPGFPPVGQTSNALVPVTPVSSTNILLPTVPTVPQPVSQDAELANTLLQMFKNNQLQQRQQISTQPPYMGYGGATNLGQMTSNLGQMTSQVSIL